MDLEELKVLQVLHFRGLGSQVQLGLSRVASSTTKGLGLLNTQDSHHHALRHVHITIYTPDLAIVNAMGTENVSRQGIEQTWRSGSADLYMGMTSPLPSWRGVLWPDASRLTALLTPFSWPVLAFNPVSMAPIVEPQARKQTLSK